MNGKTLGHYRIGSITPGHFTDIVAVNGNHLTDRSELGRVVFVMKGSATK